MLYTYKVVIKGWKAPVLCLGLLLVLIVPLMPSSVAKVAKVIYMSVTPKSGSLAWHSLWNPRFLYPVAYLTSPFGYWIGILIITLKAIEFLLPALDFFTLSFSHLSEWHHNYPWHVP